MGLIWSVLVEAPLDFLFATRERQNRLLLEAPRKESSQNLLAQAAAIAAQERFFMHSDEEEDIEQDGDADLASSVASDSESDISLDVDKTPSDSENDCSDFEAEPTNYPPRYGVPALMQCGSVSGQYPEDYAHLQWDCLVRCGIQKMKKSTLRTFQMREKFGTLKASRKSAVFFSYLPNRRKIVGKVNTKTFCAHYIHGNDVLTANQDGTIRFYSRLRHSKNRYALETEISCPVVSWSVLDVAVSPNSEVLAYGTWRDEAYICRIDKRSLQRNRHDVEFSPTWQHLPLSNEDDERRNMALFQLRFSRDGQELLCGGSSFHIYAIDVETKAVVLDLPAHEDDVNAVCFGDRNHLVYSAGDDGLCKVWDRRAMNESNDPVGVFAGHRDGITSVDTRGDDRYVLTNSKDQSMKVWDLRRFASAEAIEQTRRSVTSQRWDYRWNSNPLFRTGNLLPGDCSVMTLYGHVVRHTLIRARFSPPSTGSRLIYTGCATGKALVFDLVTGRLESLLPGHQSVIRECDWNPDTNEILTSSWDGQTFFWRYDPRASKGYEAMGVDEESCDEFYEAIPKRCEHRCRKRHVAGGLRQQACSNVPRVYTIDPYDTDIE